MKSKIVVLVIGIGLILWARVGTAEMGIDVVTGNPVIMPSHEPTPTNIGPSSEQEKRDKQRFEWQKEDRQNQKREKEEKEAKAIDAARGAAYKKAKAAHRSKVAKMRKGQKSFKSWQLSH